MIGRENGAEEEYLREVRQKARRLSRSRQQQGGFWRHVAHVGSLGFVFVLPLVAGAALGHFVAERTGRPIIAVVFLLAGLVIGAFGSWRLIQQSYERDRE